MRVAGVMSGTSLDGIDVAIVDIHGRHVEAIGFQSTPYSEETRRAILAVSNTTTTTREISRLNFELGELYARAIQRACRRYGPVDLIGCHGQTIYHEGGVATMQIGEAAVIAEHIGVPVISDFRPRDIAAGGQGAPLVPFVDRLLFGRSRRTRIALNIGGIANITVMPAGIAFDTGPGNMVIDALVRESTGGKQNFDRGGRIAARGNLNRDLLDRLLVDPYYRRRPPKSAGREQYGVEFVARLRRTGLPLPDLIATATVLTAATTNPSIWNNCFPCCACGWCARMTYCRQPCRSPDERTHVHRQRSANSPGTHRTEDEDPAGRRYAGKPGFPGGDSQWLGSGTGAGEFRKGGAPARFERRFRSHTVGRKNARYGRV